MPSKWIALTWFVLTWGCLAAGLSAQTDNGGLSEEDVKQAELEARRAKALFEVADYANKLQGLDYPKSDFEPPAAGLTVAQKATEAGYYGELLSYYSLEASVEKFFEIANLGENQELVVTTDFDLSKTAALHGLVKVRADHFDDLFHDLTSIDVDAVGSELESSTRAEIVGFPALAEAASVLGAAAEVAAFFRTNRSLAGRAVSPSDDALLTAIAKHAKEYDLVIPRFSLHREGWFADWHREIRDQEGKAEEKHKALEKKLGVAGLDDKIKAKVKELGTLTPNTPQHQKVLAGLAALRAKKAWWSKHNTAYTGARSALDAFVQSLVKREKGAPSAIEQLHFMDVLEKKSTDALVLIAKVISQGADVESSTGTFRKTRISYVGGSASSFLLLEKTGKVRAAELLPIVASKSFVGRIETQRPKRVDDSVF